MVEGMVIKVITSCSLRPGQPRQETADGLDAVLRIARKADHHLGNLRYLGRVRRHACRPNRITHVDKQLKLNSASRGGEGPSLRPPAPKQIILPNANTAL